MAPMPRAGNPLGGHATAAGAVAAIVIVAILDILISTRAVLIPLLVVGPLLAAVGGSVRATAAVAALAITVAIGLGPFDQGLFASQHVVQILVVMAGSAFAIAAAGARVRFDRAQRAAGAALAGERAARIEANMMARASELLATAPDPEERLAQVVALAVPDLADVATVDLLQPDGTLSGGAADAAEPGIAEAVLDARRRWPVLPGSDHPIAVAARTAQAQLVRSMPAEYLERMALHPDHLEHLRRLRYSSAIVVPLVARGRTLGVFAFVRRTGRPAYDENDLRLAIELARRSATALDNARLFAELSRAERQLETVLGNLAEAVTVQAPDHGLVYVNQAAAELLECGSPEEVLATPIEDILGRFVALDEGGRPFDYTNLPGRHALAGRIAEPVVMRSISRATGLERWMLVKSRPVRDDDGQVTLAVNIMEDITEGRRAEHHQRFLAEAGKLVSSSLEVDTTLERVAWAVVPAIADWCCVELPDERGRVLHRAIAADPARRSDLDGLRGPIDGRDCELFSAVPSGGRPRLFARVDDAAMRELARDEETLARIRQLGLRSLLAVPLRAGDRVIGTVTMATDESARVLGESDLELAGEIAARAGIAVENARLHAARTHIATTLQRSLLPPRLPAVPGMTIAARFRAAGEASEVGGDFYDVFEVDGAWMIVIGDVTGKGPEAASVTSLARYTMRTAAGYESSPTGVLDRLNAALMDPERRQLCTVVCARMVPAPDGSAVVTLACAGHPPPFRLRDGRAEPIEVTGPLLGAFDGSRWRETVVEMAPGDSLVLYTDGVTDTRSDAGRFGSDRLAAILTEATDLEPDEIATRIDDALLRFQTGPQRDDVALLVIGASGAPAANVSGGSTAIAAAQTDG
jgi:serine phosphatase RsbU (regulator of sigma subunit)/PAS domain-containing protein